MPKKVDICVSTNYQTNNIMAMNKNTVLAWATWIMIFVGLGLIALGAFRYDEIAGWGFAAVGIGFFAVAWVRSCCGWNRTAALSGQSLAIL